MREANNTQSTMHFIGALQKIGRSWIYASLCLTSAVFASDVSQGSRAAVGTVSFVIGTAKLIPSAGSVSSASASANGNANTKSEIDLTKGSVVHVGDQLVTRAGGHVHIQFVDGARVSLRPLSRLTIENYTKGSGSQESAIRFRLDEGVVRSITGDWGEADRERFRLNTPLAAIGIKGTDFIVKTDANRTLASVVTGSIVLSPMDTQCRANLGACDNGRAQTLSDAMRGQMIELKKDQLNPSLIPAFDLLAKKDATTRLQSNLLAEKKQLASSDEAAASESQAAAGDPASQAVTLGASAVTAAKNEFLSKETLVWARWPWTNLTSDNQFTKSFEEAHKAGLELLAGTGAYALYRDNSINPVFSPNTTSANFDLKNGTATLYQPTTYSYQVVKIDSGSLAVNFAKETFSTALQLSNPVIGKSGITADGVVTSSGRLVGTGGDAAVQGGLSNTAKSAGYQFEKSYPQGTVTGITLWGR